MKNEENVNEISETKFKIKTDKGNEMDLYLRIYGNDKFPNSIYSKNEYPSRKFELI